jgi:hypothetical protein
VFCRDLADVRTVTNQIKCRGGPRSLIRRSVVTPSNVVLSDDPMLDLFAEFPSMISLHLTDVTASIRSSLSTLSEKGTSFQGALAEVRKRTADERITLN